MQVETVGTSHESIAASNPQDTQKNRWTCVNWYNTVFDMAARKTCRIFGHVVAGFVSVFTFIPSLTVDLTHAVINLYDRKISRPETLVQNQVSTAVMPASVSSDISAHSSQSSVGLTPAQKQVPSCDLNASTTIGLSGQLSETTNETKKLPLSVTDQKPLADSQQYPLQPTLTKEAENDGVPQTSEQSPPVLSEEQRLLAFIKWLNDKTEEHGLLIDKSARIIQGVGRSYLRSKGILSTAALAEYKLLCNHDSIREMPQAEAGSTSVALPEAYPEIVLKESLDRSESRFTQMILVRKELKELGCSHLIVPRVIRVGGFLIEQRLPISINSFDNIRLYCSQPGLFDEAVREMVRLSTVCDITSDLLDDRIDPLRKSAGVKDFVRYDNLPLYKVSIDGVEQGRLGLIDIEQMNPTQYGETLRNITRIFPYHYDIIKEEADRLEIPYDDEVLKAAVADGKKYLAVEYEDYYKWLQEKGGLDNLKGLSLGISHERMNDLKKAVTKELMLLNEGVILTEGVDYTVRSPEGFLKDGAKSAEILSDGITETVIKNLTREFNENFRQNAQGKTPAQLAKSNLVQLRSLVTENDKIIEGVSVYFRPSDHYEKKPNNNRCFPMTVHECMIGKLVGAIFDELVNGGEMQAYNKTGVDGLISAYWIRC